MTDFCMSIYLFHLSCRCRLSSVFGPWVSTWHKAGKIRIIFLPLCLTWGERGTTIQKDVPKFWGRSRIEKQDVGDTSYALFIAIWIHPVPECCRILLFPLSASGVLCFSWLSLCSNVSSLTLWVSVLPRLPRASPEPIRGSVAPLALLSPRDMGLVKFRGMQESGHRGEDRGPMC